MKEYIEIAYSEEEKPFSDYPRKLAAYLTDRFDLKKDMKLLDNGCGRGDFMKAFSELGFDVYGTDISRVCEKVIKVNLENEPLPFPDNYFDIVFSKSVIEHIANSEHYINEMHRVLKKGGILIIMSPDWKSQYKIFFEDPTHIHPYCVKSIKQLLAMQKFNNSGAEIFYQLPIFWKYPFFKKLDFLKRGVSKVHKNKLYRFFREKMVLGWGYK